MLKNVCKVFFNVFKEVSYALQSCIYLIKHTAAITPFFSVKWSLRNQSDVLIQYGAKETFLIIINDENICAV